MYRTASLLILIAGTVIGAADPAVPPPAPQPDPTTAVVAEGRFVYRQRDLDALMLIAKRHAHGRVSEGDQEILRQALARLFTAREALVDALTALPPSYTGKARDGLILDLLDYQAEPAVRAVAAPTAVAPTAGPVATAAPAPTAAAKDPVLVRLPPLTLNRVIAGKKRQLTLGLALHFRDPDLARKLEPQAPLIQDAILAAAQKLTDASFSDPDQIALKDMLVKSIQAKVSDFPADGILIPQLDTGDGTTGDGGK